MTVGEFSVNSRARGRGLRLKAYGRVRALTCLGAALLLLIYLLLGVGGIAHAAAPTPLPTPPTLPTESPASGIATPAAATGQAGAAHRGMSHAAQHPSTTNGQHKAATSPATSQGHKAATNPRHSAATGRHHSTTPATDNQPLHLPAYTPVGVGAGGTLDGATLLGLVAKFAVVLLLLFIALRILRAVMPRMQGAGAKAASGGVVLHSESLGDKNRLSLLDLEELIVVVGISSTGMTPLAVVEDKEKMAALRAHYSPHAATGEARRGDHPIFAAALKEVLSGAKRADGADGDTVDAWGRASEVSDITYIRDTSLTDALTNGHAGEDQHSRLSEALDRVRLLRKKVEER